SLREAEEREIAEILFALSEELRRELPGLELAANAITELDFVNAKAVFAARFNCIVPEIGTEPLAVASGFASEPAQVTGSSHLKGPHDPLATAQGSDTTIEFVDARHPLLEESLRETNAKVVPVSFKLDDQNTTMVISGANAGGK